jgi:hypothetical protein
MKMIVDATEVIVTASPASNEVRVDLVSVSDVKRSMVLHLNSTEATVLATALKEERAKLNK